MKSLVTRFIGVSIIAIAIDGCECSGPRGKQGQPGTQGQAGPQGQPGAQGQAGPQGQIGPQGLPGDPGQTGPQGQQGAQGQTGPQGQPGAQGQTGPQGLPGAQGQTGLQGQTGPVAPMQGVSVSNNGTSNNLTPLSLFYDMQFGPSSGQDLGIYETSTGGQAVSISNAPGNNPIVCYMVFWGIAGVFAEVTQVNAFTCYSQDGGYVMVNGGSTQNLGQLVCYMISTIAPQHPTWGDNPSTIGMLNCSDTVTSASTGYVIGITAESALVAFITSSKLW